MGRETAPQGQWGGLRIQRDCGPGIAQRVSGRHSSFRNGVAEQTN